MGQRLVVTINADSKPKMKIYYHWSAYTSSTFDELQKLWKIIKQSKKVHGDDIDAILLDIIHGVEEVDEEYKKAMESLASQLNHPIGRSYHGGIDGGGKSDEFAYIQRLYPNETFKTDPDRNCGLIAMSDKGMNDLDDWAEGTASIDIVTNEISNEVFYSLDEGGYVEWNEDGENTPEKLTEEFHNIPTVVDDGYDLFVCKGDEIFKTMERWRYLNTRYGDIKDKNDIVFKEIG